MNVTIKLNQLLMTPLHVQRVHPFRSLKSMSHAASSGGKGRGTLWCRFPRNLITGYCHEMCLYTTMGRPVSFLELWDQELIHSISRGWEVYRAENDLPSISPAGDFLLNLSSDCSVVSGERTLTPIHTAHKCHIRKCHFQQGVVPHTCDPSPCEAKVAESLQIPV